MHIQIIKMADAPFAHADACCITSKKRQECLPQRLLSKCPSQRLQCGVLGRPIQRGETPNYLEDYRI
jgi:hypothetical protein